MSRLVARILLSILMFPLAGLFYIVCIFVMETAIERSGNYSQSREVQMVMTAGFLTWIVVAIYWCALWASAIGFTARRLRGTFFSAAGALVAGIVTALLTWSLIRGSEGGSLGAFIGSVLTIILWLIGTILAWQETAAERAARIKASGKSTITCPKCGYNMTGLTESRCPECGSKFTLDELMAAQVHEAGDVE
jgi:hypothetical protein